MKRQSAFTLIEVMFVLVIFGIIMAFFVPKMGKYLKRAKVKAASKSLTTLKYEVELYNTDHGKYPTSAEGLAAVVDDEKEALDPWGNAYDYNSPPIRFKDAYKRYEIISYGPDGEESEDDLHVGS